MIIFINICNFVHFQHFQTINNSNLWNRFFYSICLHVSILLYKIFNLQCCYCNVSMRVAYSNNSNSGVRNEICIWWLMEQDFFLLLGGIVISNRPNTNSKKFRAYFVIFYPIRLYKELFTIRNLCSNCLPNGKRSVLAVIISWDVILTLLEQFHPKSNPND